MNRLILLLAILGIGLVLLILNHDSGRTFGMNNDDFGQLVALGALATLFAAGIVRSRRTLGEGLTQIAIWILIAVVLVGIYVYRFDLRSVGERVLAGLMPGRAMVITDSEGQQEVVLHKRIDGHFAADATINGHDVSMLVDTGASSIVLTMKTLRRSVSTSQVSATR